MNYIKYKQMRYLILLILAGNLLLQSCMKKPVKLFTVKEVQTAADVTLLDVDQRVLNNLKINHLQQLELEVPVSGKNIVLQLEQQNLFTPDFQVLTDKGKVSFVPELYYSGKVKGLNQSLVSLSVGNEMIGFISSAEGNTNLAPIGEDYGIYAQSDQPFTCGASESPIEEKYRQKINDVVRAQGGNCVSIDFELTYECFQTFGSVSAASNWFIQLFSGVKAFYTQEGMNISIKTLFVHTSEDGYSDNPSTALTQLQSRRLNDPNFTGNVVHLIRVQSSNLSGIAYLDALCSPYNKAFSQVTAQISGNLDFSWNVMVIIHETGHVLASNHTHWCGWSGGAIDGCASVEGSCTQPPLPPAGSGTAMSYCHMNVGIRFSNGFGPQPKAKILSRISTGACTSCGTNPPPPTCTDGIKNGSETGIDCGGSCVPCPINPTCSDGIKNGNETGVDCGGNCPVCPPTTTPISQGKPATQSTTYPVAGVDASKAVDGNTATINHTLGEISPWLIVDLQGTYNITSAMIYNRIDCCSDRLRKFVIYISDDTVFSPAEIAYSYNGAVFQSLPVTFAGKKGRYIRLQAENSPANYLHLREFMIYGTPATTVKCDTFHIVRDSIVCR